MMVFSYIVIWLGVLIGTLALCTIAGRSILNHHKKLSIESVSTKPDYVAIDRMEYDMDICGVATDKRERDEQQRLKSIADAKAKMEKWDAEGVEYNCITNGYGDIVAVTPIFSPGGYQPDYSYEEYEDGILKSWGPNWSYQYAHEYIRTDFRDKWKHYYNAQNNRRQQYGYDENDFGTY